MTTAIILAGGSGSRIGATLPKQFIEVKGKPILVYTLESFQKHPKIDRIVVVCISGWKTEIEKMISCYHLNKITNIVTGGDTALDSIKNGISAIPFQSDDIIVIHDGVRPLVDAESISEVIKDCKIYGGAISSIPLVEHVIISGRDRTDLHYIPRENSFRTITPQAYLFSKIESAFRKSEEMGIGQNSAFIGTLMMDVGEKVCLSKGSEKNIKITDIKDVYYFKSLFE